MIDTIKLIFEEHKQYKKQIFKLAKSDLVRTYKGAALGWSWAVIKPMVTIFVFWFGFTVGLRSGKPVEGYKDGLLGILLNQQLSRGIHLLKML